MIEDVKKDDFIKKTYKVAINENLYRKLKAVGILYENELNDIEIKKEPFILGKAIEKTYNSFKKTDFSNIL